MNCETTRMLLAFRRSHGPEELTAADAADLATHLAGCPACAALARQAAAFDAAVGAAMKAVPAADGLRDRLLVATLARRGAAQRLRLYRSLAAAAAALALATIGYGVSHRLRPTVDTDTIAHDHSTEWENPEEMVRRFLADRDLPAGMPLDFDFRTAATCGERPISGRNAPVIVLRTWQPGQPQPDTAMIYVLKKSRFDLGGMKEKAQSSFANVEVFDTRDFAYVVVYNASLKPFLKDGGVFART